MDVHRNRRTNSKFQFLVASVLLLVERLCFVRVSLYFPATTGFVPPVLRARLSKRKSDGRAAILQNVLAFESKPSPFIQQAPDGELLQSIENTLWSYVYNLQRARKSRDTKAANSLAYFLSTHHLSTSENKLSKSTFQKTLEPLKEVLDRSLTQALRLAGESGDYRLTLKLIDSSIQFAGMDPILSPRIFGEALDALTRTQASVSKMKYIWSLVATTVNGLPVPFLSNPLTAFELNVMLKALASRSKYRACADLYRQHADEDTAATGQLAYIRPDAYTASTLFSALTESIQPGQSSEATKFRVVASRNLTQRPPASKLEESMTKLSRSPCWQWNSAIEALHTLKDDSQWNNYAFSALLKLQDKAQESVPGHKNGPQIAMAILSFMIHQNVSPDIVTCTLAIKAMGDPSSGGKWWKWAVEFLEQLKVDPRLPSPNEYAYSAAIVACARCGQHAKALELMEEMRTGNMQANNTSDASQGGFVAPKPNTWIYNAALSAIAYPHGNKRAARLRKNNPFPFGLVHSELAMKLLQQMKNDHHQLGLDTLPDTVTYNTIFAVFGSSQGGGGNDDKACDANILALLEYMKRDSIPRNSLTYRNAILACRNESTPRKLLKLAGNDTSKIKKGGSERHGMAYVFNAALSVLTSISDLHHFKDVMLLMKEMGIQPDSDTLILLFKVLGKNKKTGLIHSLLKTLHDGDKRVHQEVEEVVGLSRVKSVKLELTHYTSAIEACLSANEPDAAREILTMMSDHGVSPSDECMQKIADTYAQSAIQHGSGKHSCSDVVRAQAQLAYEMADAFNNTSPAIFSRVARACAVARRWAWSQDSLHRVHQALLATGGVLHQNEVDLVWGLHTFLLRECARQGNVAMAIAYSRDIESFAESMRAEIYSQNVTGYEGDDYLASLRKLQLSPSNVHIGMREQDWVSLTIAASKAGDWRTCIRTLQCLQPFVEMTKIGSATDDRGMVADARYNQLTHALSATSMCLQRQSKSAWAVRVLEDWMDWSDRPLRHQVVLPAIRLLCTRGRTNEARQLLTKCLIASSKMVDAKSRQSYDELLYKSFITALYQNGLHDDSEEVFQSAVEQNDLSFTFTKRTNEKSYSLQLYGMNEAMAHAAIRHAMRKIATDKSGICDLVVNHGEAHTGDTRPISPTAVQRMLRDKFHPRINALSVGDGNGALLVRAKDIDAWNKHQRKEVNGHMLALAAILKRRLKDYSDS